jgi:glyoxylase-like metal-dependent hydrolase (beta-lactamase superfamily II)
MKRRGVAMRRNTNGRIMPIHRTRALLLTAVFILAATSALAGTVAPSDLGITVRRISTRVAVVQAGPWNNSYLAIATQKGMAVIDSGFSKTVAQAVRKAIEAEFKRTDFAYLINSHEHSDHTFGNGAYPEAAIVGSDLMRKAILGMKADPSTIADRLAIPAQGIAAIRESVVKDPKLKGTPQVVQGEKFWNIVQADYTAGIEYLPPSILFDRRMALNLGDVSVHLFSFGHWHSVADTIVSIPEEHIVRLGAILYGEHLPVFKNPYGPKEEMTTAMVNNWIAMLHEVLDQTDQKTQFVSCHGWEVMTKAQVAPQVAYMDKLWTEVSRAKADGKTLPQAKQALTRAQLCPELAGLADAGLQVPNIHEHNIEALWAAAP